MTVMTVTAVMTVLTDGHDSQKITIMTTKTTPEQKVSTVMTAKTTPEQTVSTVMTVMTAKTTPEQKANGDVFLDFLFERR